MKALRWMSLGAIVAVVTAFTQLAAAQDSEGQSVAEIKTGQAIPVRIVPVAGAASFARHEDDALDNFDDSFAVGIFVDFGTNAVVLETGILSLHTRGATDGETAAFRIDSWGVPILGKWNMSGKPNETVFLKLGVMPFQTSGDQSEFDIMAVGGLGAAIPIGMSTAITLDASYNRLLDDSGDLSRYQGVALLAGLSLSL